MGFKLCTRIQVKIGLLKKPSCWFANHYESSEIWNSNALPVLFVALSPLAAVTCTEQQSQCCLANPTNRGWITSAMQLGWDFTDSHLVNALYIKVGEFAAYSTMKHSQLHRRYLTTTLVKGVLKECCLALIKFK